MRAAGVGAVGCLKARVLDFDRDRKGWKGWKGLLLTSMMLWALILHNR